MSCATVTDIPIWYAIHTHPKQENRAEMNLRAWNVETFFPKVKDCRFNEFTGDPSYFVKPLFLGYLFARFGLESLLHKVRFTRGVHSVVCIGSDPALIDSKVIEIIAAQIDESGFVKIGAGLEPGARVLIQAGPFKGLTGIVELEARTTDRIKILLACVSFLARVELERKYVRAL